MRNVLIVSDYEQGKTFRTIEVLQQEIQEIIGRKVDLITLSEDGLFLNQNPLEATMSEARVLDGLWPVLERKAYDMVVISLGIKYLRLVFPSGLDAVDLIKKSSPRAVVYVFGARTILGSKATSWHERNVFFYPRRGVAKITSSLKSAIFEKIETSGRRKISID